MVLVKSYSKMLDTKDIVCNFKFIFGLNTIGQDYIEAKTLSVN